MAKLSVEQRGKIRTWLREQLAADPTRNSPSRSPHDEEASRALGFEISPVQLQAAYRDIFPISPAQKEQLEEWLNTHWGRALDGHPDFYWSEGQISTLRSILCPLIGMHPVVADEYINAARRTVGKEWGFVTETDSFTYWADNAEGLSIDLSMQEVRHRQYRRTPIAALTVLAGSDPETIRSFLEEMLGKVETLIEEANQGRTWLDGESNQAAS
jgi:hypothetical protein